MALATALVVISLATALKDIIEVAQEIRESFEKLPQNYRNALALATDISKTCEKMKKIYGEKEDIFDRTPDLFESLKELYREMVVVHEKCTRLVPPITEKKKQRFKIVLYAFINREKVSGLILGLKDHVDNCYKQFLLLSNIRIEATVNQIAHMLSIVAENQSSALYVRASTMAYSDHEIHISDFVQSSPALMPTLHATIPKDVLTKAYLRREIESVEKLLARLVSRWARTPPAEFPVHAHRTAWGLKSLSVTETATQRNLVIDVFRLQTTLEGDDATIILTFGSSAASVSARLADKQLHAESLIVRKLGAQFWGQLVLLHPSRNARISLLDQLSNLSICYYNVGETKQAYYICQKTIDEILHLLSIEESALLRELLARNLALQASSTEMNNSATSLELAGRAVSTLEHLLSVEGLAHIDDNIISARPNHDSWYTYSNTLLSLSTQQEKIGSLAESIVTQKRALQVVSGLAKIYPSSRRVLKTKAEILHTLFGYKYSSRNSLRENLAYGEECTAIFECLLHGSESISDLYLLSTALLGLKHTLQTAGRLEDSEIVYNRITSLAESAAQRFSDLQLIPSDTAADYYYHLAITQRSEHRIQDAIQAVKVAIVQYATLDSFDRNRSPLKHVKAVCLLSTLFCASGQYEAAISEGYKAIKIIDDAIGEPSLFSTSTQLQVVENIVDALENTQGTSSTLQRTTEIMNRFMAIFTHPAGKTIAVHTRIPATYLLILEKNRMFSSAVKYSEGFLATWKDTPDYYANPDIVYPYLQCFSTLANLLKRRGQRDEAMKYLSQAIHLARKYAHPNNSILIRHMRACVECEHISLLIETFRYKDALKASQELIQLYNNNLEDSESMITMPQLQCLVSSYLNNCLPGKAKESATRGLELCRSELAKGKAHPRSWVYIFRVGLMDALLDQGRVGEALDCLKEAEDSLSALRSSDVDHARYILWSRRSQLLFTNKEYSKSVALIPKVVETDRKALMSDKYVLERLARVLRFAGLAFCSNGEHERGIASLAELEGLMQEYTILHPDCAHRAQLHLAMEEKRGKWEVITRTARSVLSCSHQDKILDNGLNQDQDLGTTVLNVVRI